ncbi:thiamine phosphate synthase [Fodinibius sediminis]|uniref:Thiamine-phosphate synthase n=1 Tax=Fodinibius sediminis TaxID=1214077 RepID=A0A521AIU0_9BACT|nr:thiamine phosphate synthase [Fodinibius sediminis]SMO34610.1 thiamine-phosphate diphosphorylase [Fodinibius sediminis]
MSNSLDFRYYLITDRRQCRPRPLPDVVAAACRQGIKAVQLREKDLGGRALFAMAEQLREVTARWNAKLFINDRVDVALGVGADGVHCRETSMSSRDVKQLEPSLSVGVSVHSLQSARRAEREGADFLLFGPVFYTASKAKYGAPQGLAALKDIAGAAGIPTLAVGGITPKRAVECRTAGAWGVGGISSVMATDSIPHAVDQWKLTLDSL